MDGMCKLVTGISPRSWHKQTSWCTKSRQKQQNYIQILNRIVSTTFLTFSIHFGKEGPWLLTHTHTRVVRSSASHEPPATKSAWWHRNLDQFNNATTEHINPVLLQDVALSQKTVYRERVFPACGGIGCYCTAKCGDIPASIFRNLYRWNRWSIIILLYISTRLGWGTL